MITKTEFKDFLFFTRKSLNIGRLAYAKTIGITVNILSSWEEMVDIPDNVEEVVQNIKGIVKSEVKRKREVNAEQVR